MSDDPIKRRVIFAGAPKVELYLGDALEILPTLETGSADLLLTDPPYPELKGGAKRLAGGVAPRRNWTLTVGDEWQAGLGWMEDAWRICRFGMLVFCSYHSVDSVKAFRRENAMALLTWFHPNAGPSINNVPRFCTEYIWAFRKAPGLKWRGVDTGLWTAALPGGCFGSERVRLEDGTSAHPTQKPLAVMEWLLACEPKSVVDPFMGTGTAGVTCAARGISFVGIERDPAYFNIAVRRISEAREEVANRLPFAPATGEMQQGLRFDIEVARES